jgi:hypothetical protein
MRTPAVVVVVALAAIPLAARPAAAGVTLVRGSGAIASLSHTSADGCVHTVAEIAAVQGAGGEVASGVYVTGSQEDVCAGTGNGFAGYSPGGFTGVGLLFGRVHATVAAPSYSGGADVPARDRPTWLGAGPISRTTCGRRQRDHRAVERQPRSDHRRSVIADGVALDVDGALCPRLARRQRERPPTALRAPRRLGLALDHLADPPRQLVRDPRGRWRPARSCRRSRTG